MALIAKYIPPLSDQQKDELARLASLNFATFNESDVREEFLVCLITLLGYERNSDYQVLREHSYNLNPLFLNVGSRRIRLDYRFNVYKIGFWLLEAKEGRCADPSHPPAISSGMIEQAYFYAHHREIDCSIFGVSNGWWTNLYDRDAEDPMQAMVSIFHRDLPTRFLELYSKIGATQVTFEIKRRILRRMEQVLAADVDLERMNEFIQAAQGIAAKVRPLVLENYRKNAKVRESAMSREFLSYLENSRPYDIIQTITMANLNIGHMHTVVQVVSKKVAESAGVDHFLFFHRLVVADTRAVTTSYYTSALLLLMDLCRNPDLAKIDYPLSDGKRSGELRPLFFDFVRMVLYHFESRPDLRVIWAMEGLLTRMISRTLVSNETSRTDITAGVAGARYLLPESEIAFLGPSPGRTVAQAVDSMVLAQLGAFVARHSTTSPNLTFDTRSAREEFRSIRNQFEPVEAATDASYRELVRSLGNKWRASFGAEVFNRHWDKLGFSACELLGGQPELLKELPQDIKSRIAQLARLGNQFARACCASCGIPVSDGNHPQMGQRLQTLFDPDASPLFDD